jgi:exosortase/archaeosortase family protein
VGAAPIAIVSNILRVILLVLLVAWQGGDILETFVHPLSGIMTFALSLPIIFWLGGEQRAAPVPASLPTSPPPSPAR